MTELIPLLSGLVLGAFARRRALPLVAVAAAIVALGIAVAFVSGELQVNRAFALVDIAIGGTSAAAGAWVARRFGQLGSRYRASARKERSGG